MYESDSLAPVSEARRTIAGIEIGRILGAGSSAVVYAGRVSATRQKVAVKIVRPRSDQPPDVVERALQEARVGWTVRHPNVVRVLEWGMSPEGEVYLVLERLVGRTLGALLREAGRLAVPRALAVARQIAAGLGALHAHDALHRDVKPDNVFVLDGPTERVKLLDMGLVQLRLDDPHRMAWTAQGLSLGTPGYLAPEQVRGEPVTTATDVFGLGATLFHAIVGRPPYPSEASYEALRVVAMAASPPMVPARVPADVAALLRAMLHPEPSARPADAEAVLDGLMSLQPPPSPPPEPPPPLCFPGRVEGGAQADLRARISAAVSSALTDGSGSSALRARLADLDAMQTERRSVAARCERLRDEADALGLELADRHADTEARRVEREVERQAVRARYLESTARLMELADEIEAVDRRYVALALAFDDRVGDRGRLAAELAALSTARRSLEAAQTAVRRALRDGHQAARALTGHVLEARRALLDVELERSTRLAELDHLVRAGEDQLAALDRSLEHAFLELGVGLRLEGVALPVRLTLDEAERTIEWRRASVAAERRGSARHRCELIVRVQGEGIDAELTARDIGPGGVFLYADAQPRADRVVLVLRGDERPVRLQGDVVHRLPGIGFGVAFRGAPPELLELLGPLEPESTRTFQ